MTFGERIKAILIFKKVSQKDFASQINISESQLSKMLNNKKKPTTKELMNIIKALNVPYDCIVGNVSLFDELLKSNIYDTTVCQLW